MCVQSSSLPFCSKLMTRFTSFFQYFIQLKETKSGAQSDENHET